MEGKWCWRSSESKKNITRSFFFFSEMSDAWFQEESHITSNVQQGEIGSLHLTHPEGAVGSVWTHPGIWLNLQSPWFSLTKSLANIWSWSPGAFANPWSYRVKPFHQKQQKYTAVVRPKIFNKARLFLQRKTQDHLAKCRVKPVEIGCGYTFLVDNFGKRALYLYCLLSDYGNTS